eukprot:363737-Rhodomonas_salina.1
MQACIGSDEGRELLLCRRSLPTRPCNAVPVTAAVRVHPGQLPVFPDCAHCQPTRVSGADG